MMGYTPVFGRPDPVLRCSAPKEISGDTPCVGTRSIVLLLPFVIVIFMGRALLARSVKTAASPDRCEGHHEVMSSTCLRDPRTSAEAQRRAAQAARSADRRGRWRSHRGSRRGRARSQAATPAETLLAAVAAPPDTGDAVTEDKGGVPAHLLERSRRRKAALGGRRGRRRGGRRFGWRRHGHRHCGEGPSVSPTMTVSARAATPSAC